MEGRSSEATCRAVRRASEAAQAPRQGRAVAAAPSSRSTGRDQPRPAPGPPLPKAPAGVGAAPSGAPTLSTVSLTTDLGVLVTVLCALVILVGVVGSAVQVLPGPVLIAAATLVWALVQRTGWGWAALVVAVVALVAGQVLKWLLAGRALARARIPRSTVVLAALCGVVGFFVVPVVGLPLFFVAALFLVELTRLRSAALAWPSTVTALKAVGIVALVELGTSLVAATVWGTAVVFTYAL